MILVKTASGERRCGPGFLKIKEMNIDVKHIATLTGHSGCVYAMDKGISEQTVFSGGSDMFIALWNLETLQAEKFATSFPAPVYAICYIPEKNYCLRAQQQEVI